MPYDLNDPQARKLMASPRGAPSPYGTEYGGAAGAEAGQMPPQQAAPQLDPRAQKDAALQQFIGQQNQRQPTDAEKWRTGVYGQSPSTDAATGEAMRRRWEDQLESQSLYPRGGPQPDATPAGSPARPPFIQNGAMQYGKFGGNPSDVIRDELAKALTKQSPSAPELASTLAAMEHSQGVLDVQRGGLRLAETQSNQRYGREGRIADAFDKMLAQNPRMTPAEQVGNLQSIIDAVDASQKAMGSQPPAASPAGGGAPTPTMPVANGPPPAVKKEPQTPYDVARARQQRFGPEIYSLLMSPKSRDAAGLSVPGGLEDPDLLTRLFSADQRNTGKIAANRDEIASMLKEMRGPSVLDEFVAPTLLRNPLSAMGRGFLGGDSPDTWKARQAWRNLMHGQRGGSAGAVMNWLRPGG